MYLATNFIHQGTLCPIPFFKLHDLSVLQQSATSLENGIDRSLYLESFVKLQLLTVSLHGKEHGILISPVLLMDIGFAIANKPTHTERHITTYCIHQHSYFSIICSRTNDMLSIHIDAVQIICTHSLCSRPSFIQNSKIKSDDGQCSLNIDFHWAL